MCTNPADFSQESHRYLKDDFLQRLKALAFKNPGLESILFTGGEPTIHPDFLEILRQTRKILPRTQIKILTNGRTFFYEKFAKEILQTKNLSLAFSFCGASAQAHDAVTRSIGSFAQAKKGLQNALKHRHPATHHLEIRTVLTKFLLKENKTVWEFLKKEFREVETIVFLFPEIEGLCEQNLKVIVPTYSEVKRADFFENFLRFVPALKDPRLYHFPLCAVPPSLWPFVWRTMDAKDTTFVKKCDKCLYQKSCLGIPVGYKRFFGVKEFKPILKKQPVKETGNEFHPIER